jgi:hypothetical protein
MVSTVLVGRNLFAPNAVAVCRSGRGDGRRGQAIRYSSGAMRLHPTVFVGRNLIVPNAAGPRRAAP